MTLQWTLVATFLYVEVAFMFILLLPFISATRWQKIFRSRLVRALTSYAGIYFNVILLALVLLLLDAIREIVKYKNRLHTSNDGQHGQGVHYGPTMELVKEFRAQRNFYISGTALFLWFVLKRLLALISNSAHLIAESQAARSQAESANRTAELLLKSSTKPSESKSSSTDKENEKDLSEVIKVRDQEIQMLNQSLKTAKIDLEVMKKQSESVTREYDNLLKEHAKIAARLEKFENGSESKKDN